ncbi:hypothetical protein KFL_001940060 [Klebsormidium nitens]|uniref:Tetraspanin family protein n=1 Tax=Klebsormidium nitens TaxID=105231 RepID=A0A1Y1I553_KLENI|nr:hypothetical protein KFL_001940060 [Klebsormidium nitens]|eukprot:GAQ84549.1 hypothetical protein KFL_001940060 [Klebsormidium nitens]
MGCRSCLQCILKLNNFLLAIVGALLIAYSLWMLNEYSAHHPGAPAPAPYYASLELPHGQASGVVLGRAIFEEPALVHSHWHWPDLSKWRLPAPWFIYGTLALGIFTTLTSCTGLIGAESGSRVCLSCYNLGLLLLVGGQVIAGALIYFDRSWEEDIPRDPTGQLDKARRFVGTNRDLAKIAGCAVLAIEVVGWVLSMVLRALLPSRRQPYYDSDDDYAPAARAPLLPRNAATGPAGAAGGTAAPARRNDQWSSRMKAKYGLDTAELANDPARPRTAASQSGAAEGAAVEAPAAGSRCSIL